MSEKAVIISIVTVFIIIASLGLSPLPAPYGDNARYLILARSFLEGKVMRLINFPDEPLETKVQPLYPLFLAFLMRLFGYRLLILKVSSLVFMALAVVFFYLTMRRLQIARFVRLTVLVLLVLNPFFLEYSRVVLSEASFIFLLSLVVLFFTEYELQGRVRLLLVGLFFAVSMAFIRDASIIAILAIAGLLAGRRQYKISLAVFFLTAAIGALWLYKNIYVKTGYLREFIGAGNYLEPFAGTISPGAFIRRYVYEAAAYVGDIFPDLIIPVAKGIAPHSRFWLLKIVFGLVCFSLTGLGLLKLRAQTKARFFLVFPLWYVFCLPLFGTYGIRYLIPAWFFIAMFMVYGLSALSRRTSRGIIVGLTIAFVVLYIVEEKKNIAYIRQGFPGAVAHYYNALGFLREKAELCPHDVIMCRKPFLAFILSEHKTIGYPYTLDTEEMYEYIKSSQARFLIVDSWVMANKSFSRMYLLPTVQAYTESFRLVYATEDPVTEVYEVIR